MKTTTFAQLITKNEENLPFFVTSIGICPEENHVYRPNGIDSYQLLYTHHGCGIANINSSFTRIPPRSLFRLPPGTAHNYYPESDVWNTYWITFRGWGISQLFNFSAGVSLLPESFDFINRFEAISACYKTDYQIKRSSVLLYSLLLELREFITEESQSIYSLRHKLKPCFKYIEENYMNIIELSALSAVCGISGEHLCRLFREYTGMRPFEYIKKLRIQKAKEMIAAFPSLSVSEISKRAGFQSSSYFTLVFRETQGCTPGQYRTYLKKV